MGRLRRSTRGVKRMGTCLLDCESNGTSRGGGTLRGAAAGPSDPPAPQERAGAQRIKGTPGITG